jgi:hypothetical protein
VSCRRRKRGESYNTHVAENPDPEQCIASKRQNG